MFSCKEFYFVYDVKILCLKFCTKINKTDRVISTWISCDNYNC